MLADAESILSPSPLLADQRQMNKDSSKEFGMALAAILEKSKYKTVCNYFQPPMNAVFPSY